MKPSPSWPYHGSLSKESFDSRVAAGLPIRPAEAMKPGVHALRDLRMVAKRSRLLDKLMAVLLEEHDLAEVAGTPRMVRWVPGAEKVAQEIWGKYWYLHRDLLNWRDTFMMWWQGGVRRAAEVAEANLPLEKS